jgi:hypothetical protein
VTGSSGSVYGASSAPPTSSDHGRGSEPSAARACAQTLEGDRASGHRQDVDGGEVVGLGASRHERAEEDDERPRGEAERPRTRVEKKEDDAGEPERKRQRMDDLDLAPDELRHRDRLMLVQARIAQHLERRPAVIDLPEDVREHDESRERRAPERPLREEQSPLSCEEKPGDEGDREERHGVLVEEPDSDDDADREPESRIVPPDHADREPGARRPEERLQRVHGEEAVEPEVDRRHEDREGGDDLREPTATQLARYSPGEEHEERARERRRETDRVERVPEQEPRDLRHRGDERRMVDVAPGEMIPAGDEVQLVDPVAVAAAQRDVKHDVCDSDGHHDGAAATGVVRRRGRRHYATRARGSASRGRNRTRRFRTGTGCDRRNSWKRRPRPPAARRANPRS